MSGFFFNGEGYETGARSYGPVGATAFDIGDPLIYTAGLLVPHGDGLLATATTVGFALEPDTGIRAASRPADSVTPALAAGFNGVDERSFVETGAPGLTMMTRNIANNGGAGTIVAPTAADIGIVAEMVMATTVMWLERNTPTLATNLGAEIVDVLNANMLPIRAFGGTGVWVVFRVRNN
jgi:hypothetical protein